MRTGYLRKPRRISAGPAAREPPATDSSDSTSAPDQTRGLPSRSGPCIATSFNGTAITTAGQVTTDVGAARPPGDMRPARLGPPCPWEDLIVKRSMGGTASCGASHRTQATGGPSITAKVIVTGTAGPGLR